MVSETKTQCNHLPTPLNCALEIRLLTYSTQGHRALQNNILHEKHSSFVFRHCCHITVFALVCLHSLPTESIINNTILLVSETTESLFLSLITVLNYQEFRVSKKTAFCFMQFQYPSSQNNLVNICRRIFSIFFIVIRL